MTDRNTQIYGELGGDKLVVAAGGTIDIVNGGKITDDGVQAAAIADISEVTGDMSAAERGKFNDVLAALRGVGIIAAA